MIYWNCTLLGLSYILITSFDFAFCFDSVQFIKLPNHSHGGPKSAARGQSEMRASEGLTRTAPNEFFVPCSISGLIPYHRIYRDLCNYNLVLFI